MAGNDIVGTLSAMDHDDPDDPELNECWNQWMHRMIVRMDQERDALVASGSSFALIDREPMHFCAFETGQLLPRPTKACKRRYRLDLIGGGQLKVVEHHWLRPDPPSDEHLLSVLGVTWHYGTDFTAVPHVNGRLVRFKGRLIEHIGDARMMAVTFSGGNQEVTDRVAATLRAVDNTPDNFYALLSQRTRCAVCDRPLADEISKLVGVGPECARRFGVPHSIAAANLRLEKRRQLGLTI